MLAEGATRGVQDDRFHETHPIGCHHSSLVNLACRSYILVIRSWSAYDSNHGGARLAAATALAGATVTTGAMAAHVGGGGFHGGGFGGFHGGWAECTWQPQWLTADLLQPLAATLPPRRAGPLPVGGEGKCLWCGNWGHGRFHRGYGYGYGGFYSGLGLGLGLGGLYAYGGYPYDCGVAILIWLLCGPYTYSYAW